MQKERGKVYLRLKLQRFIYLFIVDKITDFGASKCAVSPSSYYSIVLQPTCSLPPPLLRRRRSLTLSWRDIKLGTKIQQ